MIAKVPSVNKPRKTISPLLFIEGASTLNKVLPPMTSPVPTIRLVGVKTPVLLDKKIPINSDDLGKFSLEKSADDVFYLQNGFYRFNGKWKQRGFGSLGSKEIEHLETFERDGKLIRKFKVLRSKRLRTSILQNTHDEIGKFSLIEREMNLNADRKRLWIDRLESVDNTQSNRFIPFCLDIIPKMNL